MRIPTYILLQTLAAMGIIIFIMSCVRGFWRTRHFKRHGIKQIPYWIPFLGNNASVLLRREHYRDLVMRTYNRFPDQKYVGYSQFNQNFVMIRDLHILQKTTIKHSAHFYDHFTGINEHLDPFFGKMLFSLQGARWRKMRNTLSSAFSTRRMKNMFEYLEEIVTDMVQFYMDKMDLPENRERGYLEIEMKDVLSRCTNDVILSTAFGIRINSFEDRDNQYFVNGKSAANFAGTFHMKLYFLLIFSSIRRFIPMRLISQKSIDFFEGMIKEAMKSRDKEHIMIQILMKLSDEPMPASPADSCIKWTNHHLISQAFNFYVGGFDTTSNLLCFMAYELATNPTVQRKLQREIDQMRHRRGPLMNYDDLSRMPYMEMVILETLRKWPPLVVTDRGCVNDYTLPRVSETSNARYTVKKGENIWIPIYAFHHDPQYFPEPDRFIPERFAPENKQYMNQSAYMPFGIGPRSCIGNRFAKMETKCVFFHLLSKFHLIRTPKTVEKIRLMCDTSNLCSKDGLWIGLKPRIL